MAEKLSEELAKVKIEPELTDKEYMKKHYPESVKYLKKWKNKYGFDGRLNETSPCALLTNLTHHDSKSQTSETNPFKSPLHETSTSHVTPISSSVSTAPPAQRNYPYDTRNQGANHVRITFPDLDNTNTDAYLLIKVPSGNEGTQFVIQKVRGNNKQWKGKKGEKINIGKNNIGYVITTTDKVIKSEHLPSNLSAQAAELKVIIEACKLYENKEVTIYKDSQFAYGSAHIFCRQ